MSKKTEPLPGISDIFSPETHEWRAVETAAHNIFSRYGYEELRSPILERTDVFQKSIGDETDIVQKEMYTFEDRGGRSLTLRPEGTAGVMRAVANAGVPQGDERRVYYMGPMFRGERPAAGRKRQFHQIGVECIGKTAPLIDVECIDMMLLYLQEIGLKQHRLLVNTRGIASDRAVAAEALSGYFAPHIEGMCNDCKRRYTTNIWRVLDCKEPHCCEVVEDAPHVTDLLGEQSREYFGQVCSGLRVLDIPFEVDPRLVRGLDYYCHTVFEVVHDGIGAQSAIAGGGRYEIFASGIKSPLPGVGFAAGVERLLMARESEGVVEQDVSSVEVYLVGLGPDAARENMVLCAALRRKGLRVMMDLEERGLRSQMRSANRHGAVLTLIRGEEELAQGTMMCKAMVESEQQSVPLDELEEWILGKLLAAEENGDR